MKRNIIILLLALIPVSGFAQGWEVDWNASAHLLTGTGDTLPFWARTGYDGIMPYTSSSVLTAGADIGYQAENGLYFTAGTHLVGSLATRSQYSKTTGHGLVDRMYVSGGWKMLHLDVGMIPRKKELGDLSVTGGNIMYSGNARNLPGINFHTDWIYVDKRHIFGLRANFAHYQMIDNRYVTDAKLHNKALSFRFALGKKVNLIAGFEHWAQWGGNSPSYGQHPETFKDYMRIILGQNGGNDATLSDQINVLGNHLGKEYIRLDWRAKPFTMTFQYDKPFEDGSGMSLQNIPDGVWSLKFSMHDRKAFVTDVLYEFISTTWQSGARHDRPASEEEMKNQNENDPWYGRVIVGGCDNYFNNGDYRSGWTYYGRTIGCPLLIPAAPGADGITPGIVSSRVRGHHIGLRGILFENVPYTFKSTFTNFWGNYHQEADAYFIRRPWQLSLALDVEFGKDITALPLGFAVGIYGDIGRVFKDSAGVTLRVFYRDRRRF